MSKRRVNNVEADLEALAETILADALKSDTALAMRLEAFKVIVPYYSVNIKAKKAPEEPEGDSFTSFKSSISVTAPKEYKA